MFWGLKPERAVAKPELATFILSSVSCGLVHTFG